MRAWKKWSALALLAAGIGLIAMSVEAGAIFDSPYVALYAQWADLYLTATDNYSVNGGEGAVDLNWGQDNPGNRLYKIYQGTDGKTWKQVNSATDIPEHTNVREVFGFSGVQEKYTVPYSGFYSLTAYGAQGGNYKNFTGGPGGKVKGTFWLDKGDVLKVLVGGQNGYLSGGKGRKYACGGDCTQVYLEGQGVLLTAGGGGGASGGANGHEGGSRQRLCGTGMRGESGDCGGGGGAQGGTAGRDVVHYHDEILCKHVHVGQANVKGGCFTKPILCGEAVSHKYLEREHWYWSESDGQYCPKCGARAALGEVCEGHYSDRYRHSCPAHGFLEDNYSEDSPAKCLRVILYAPACGKEEEYGCGYPYDGYVISSEPGYGGSSYVNRTRALTYTETAGVRNGNGKVILQSEDVGFWRDTYCDGVTAKDMACPEKIKLSDISIYAAEEDKLQISWNCPADNGTIYYHLAESFSADGAEKISSSNITVNTLTSGIKGYYYCVDGNADTQVSTQNGTYTSARRIDVSVDGTEQYLHLMSVDVAGNVSPSTHISLCGQGVEEIAITRPLFTRPITIRQGDNVYAAQAGKTYYVKGDGETPFFLDHTAYICGPAARNYQINYALFASIDQDGNRTENGICVPGCELCDAEIVLTASDIGLFTEGMPPLQNYSFTRVVRSRRNRELGVTRGFVLDMSANGKPVNVYPIVGADWRGETVWSESGADRANGMWIIGDGEPPEIDGLDSLKELSVIDRRRGEVKLRLSASDALSGLKALRLTIQNMDNGASREWTGDAGGTLEVSITEDEPVFSGDFTIEVYACDNVGNETSSRYNVVEFDLRVEAQRMIAPHTPLVFKRGESGILHITTWGYADRVEIEFSEELLAQDETLNHVYEYELKQEYRHVEDYIFMIPLAAPENIQYEIVVRAYKGDRMLEQYPALSIVGVEGSVLDGLRTRLR